uniref:Secreted protein n=1 Tax=Zonotrichia albicollis TaxID=44394 RepID=A0A8D2MAQ9_ZONAL
MKSRWNWGSMICIMYLICAGSQRSMSSSRASSFSGPLQRSWHRASAPMKMPSPWCLTQDPLQQLHSEPPYPSPAIVRALAQLLPRGQGPAIRPIL